jgi:hypothetical protein
MSIRKVISDKTMHRVIIGEGDDSEEETVDFSNASLYLSAIQTIVSVMACASTAILACWLLPTSMVSAVRTLTLTCLVGALTMRKPIRIGHVHGLTLVFSALRPAVVVYILCLVLETLLHTCTRESDEVPSWRRVLFQAAVVGMMLSGLMRARQPLSTTDAPFLLTAVSLLVVAFLPPPAVSMQGPLCQSVSLVGAAERLIRALVFSCVYSLFVYISSPANSQYGDTVVCIMRASAASVWVLGAALPLLAFVFPQCGLAIWARLGTNSREHPTVPLCPSSRKPSIYDTNPVYKKLHTHTPPPETNDIEVNDASHIQLHCNNASCCPDSAQPPSPPESGSRQFADSSSSLSRNIGPLSFRPVTFPVHTQSAHSLANGPSKERMAEIAATIAE